MKYNIHINQKAIIDFNNIYNTDLDLTDACILEYLHTHTSNNFAKRNFLVQDNEIYYLLSYKNILKELPLLKITTADGFGRRIKKLEDCKIIKRYIKKLTNNNDGGGTKIYFNTHDIFDEFFYSVDTDSDTSRNDTDSDTSHNIYDNKTIDNNKKINKKEAKKLFLQFYVLYPKKVNKPNAEKTFFKLLESNKDDTSFMEKILFGLEKYKELMAIEQTELKFIPNPQAWLNSAGWEPIETYQAQIDQKKAKNNINSGKNDTLPQPPLSLAPKVALNEDLSQDPSHMKKVIQEFNDQLEIDICNFADIQPSYEAKKEQISSWFSNEKNKLRADYETVKQEQWVGFRTLTDWFSNPASQSTETWKYALGETIGLYNRYKLFVDKKIEQLKLEGKKSKLIEFVDLIKKLAI